MKIAIVGAYDRINYGDMLFPWIIQYELRIHDIECETEYFGLKKSDYSKIGAKKTESVKKLNMEIQKYDWIIIAGGDSMNAHIYSLELDSTDRKLLIYLKVLLRKIIGYKQYISFLKKKYYVHDEFPYNIPLSKVLYNGCGGSGLNSIEKKLKENELVNISKAKYISVRDTATYSFLSNDNVSVKLVPDTATLISQVWDRNYLSENISSKIYEIFFQKKYIVFQIGNKYTNNDYEKVKKIFDTIRLYEYEIVLLPIGRCATHGDILALRSIKKKYKNCILIDDDFTLIDTAYIIANSDMYIGSSLHGNITAFSYGVESILLSINKGKNYEYYNTWLSDTSCSLMQLDLVDEYIKCRIKYIKRDIFNLNRKLDEQLKLLESHFDDMLAGII